MIYKNCRQAEKQTERCSDGNVRKIANRQGDPKVWVRRKRQTGRQTDRDKSSYRGPAGWTERGGEGGSSLTKALCSFRLQRGDVGRGTNSITAVLHHLHTLASQPSRDRREATDYGGNEVFQGRICCPVFWVDCLVVLIRRLHWPVGPTSEISCPWLY